MKIKIPIRFVELEKDNYHPVIVAEINGEAANWVLDTGASKSVFDKNRMNDYELLGEDEEMHAATFAEKPMISDLAELKTFQIGMFTVLGLKVAIIDFAHINELYKKAGGPEICGLIGSDFLMKYKAVIDFKRQILKLQF